MTTEERDELEKSAHELERQAIDACNATNPVYSQVSSTFYQYNNRRRQGQTPEVPDVSHGIEQMERLLEEAQMAIDALGQLNERAEGFAQQIKSEAVAATQAWDAIKGQNPMPDRWGEVMSSWMSLSWGTKDADYFAYRVNCTLSHATRYLQSIRNLLADISCQKEELTTNV